jgi:hypothetical protein
MAYQPHTLITFGGTLLASQAGGINEIWQVTLRAVQADRLDHTLNDPAAYMNGIAAPLLTWWKLPASLMSSGATLDWLKVNNIGVDGKYEDQSNTNQHDYPASQFGGAAPTLPDILTVCWSWRSAKKRGPGSHGRIYLPNATAVPQLSMALTTAQQNQHLASATALIHLLSIGDGDVNEAQIVIASKVNATNTPITTISIGSIIDVQRRRKDAEVEVYVSGPSQT